MNSQKKKKNGENTRTEREKEKKTQRGKAAETENNDVVLGWGRKEKPWRAKREREK